MAEIYKGVWEDDQGNKLYSDNDTETTRDSSGIPLNNGGDLSEASVNFTVGTSRKALTPKARFKALMGDIAKWLTDLGPAAFYKVADDFTTTAENYLFTARKGKQLKDEIDGINSDLGGYQFDTIDGVPSYKAGADAVWVPFSHFVLSRIDTGTGNGNSNSSSTNIYIPGKRKITIGHVGIVNPDHYNKTMSFTIFDGDGKQLYTTNSPVDNITVTADAITTFKIYLYGWQTYATNIVAE